MRQLTVLYDANCAFCQRCRAWLEGQPKYLAMDFVPAASEASRALFPDLCEELRPGELLVISNEGAVYSGSSAFIMCLYALVEFREWSIRLSGPSLRPLARRAFKLLSQNRLRLSQLLRLGPGDGVAEAMADLDCDDGSCGLELRPRSDSVLRCPYCHDQVELAARSCPECCARFHDECWHENGGCTAVGCATSSAEIYEPPRVLPALAAGALTLSIFAGLALEYGVFSATPTAATAPVVAMTVVASLFSVGYFLSRIIDGD